MKKHLPVLLLVVCALLFAGTFYFLLRGRFEQGNVYPPSSSLRSDPLGTMIFYESLAALPGLKVDRDHSSVNRLPDGKGTTYFHFGGNYADWDSVSPDTYRITERFLLDGGRLVITLNPEFSRKKKAKEKEKEETDKEKEEKDAGHKKDYSEEDDSAGEEDVRGDIEPTEKKESGEAKESTNTQKSEVKESGPGKPSSKEDSGDKKSKKKKKRKIIYDESVSLSEKWGLRLSRESASPGGKSVAKNVSAPGLPAEFPWHGDLVMSNPGPEWTVLYRNENGPVIAERKRGAGSIVIVTDSYLVSNEALVENRQPALLAWLAGSGTHMVFDEAHHGIMESPGIASLARKYRLYGGAAALLVLAGLFIWKNSSSLAPTRAGAREESDVIVGRNASAGFIGLLRRNISTDRILGVCLDEWRKSFSRSSKYSLKEKAAVEEVAQTEETLPPKERNAVNAYEKIRKILHPKSVNRPA